MKNYALTLSVAAAALLTIPSLTFAEDKPAGERPKRPDGAGGPGKPGGPGGERRMDPEARIKFMTEKLGLTQEQQNKVKAIYEKNGPQFKELMAKGRENLTEDDKTKMRELMKSQFEEVGAVLTPEQKEKMKELRPEGRGGDRKPGERPAGPRGDRKPGEGKPGAPKPDAPKPDAAK